MPRIHWITFVNSKSTHVRARFFQGYWPSDFEISYHFFQDYSIIKKFPRRMRSVFFTLVAIFLILFYKNSPIVIQKYPPKLLILLLPVLRHKQLIYETDDATWYPQIYSEALFTKIVQNCKFIIVENHNQARYIERKFQSTKIMIWPTPTQLELRTKVGSRNPMFTIIWVGSSSTSSGVCHLIPVFKRMIEQRYQIHLILLGVSKTAGQLFKSQFPLDTVEIVHSYSMEDCFWYMSQAHVGIFPNNNLDADIFRGDHKLRIYLTGNVKVIADSIYEPQLTIREVREDIIWVNSLDDWLQELTMCCRVMDFEKINLIWNKKNIEVNFSRIEVMNNFMTSWLKM